MQIIEAIFPVFTIALLGYILTWIGVFRVNDVPGLTRYVFNIALPILLFDSLSSAALPATVEWSFLLTYYLPALSVFVIGMVISQHLFKRRRSERGIYGMSCSYSNTVLIGLPVITAALGNEALVPLLMIIAIHSAVFFSLTTAVAESGDHGVKGWSVLYRTARGMARNPIVMGLVVGLFFNVMGFTVHPLLQRVITPLRASALPVALFVTGAALREYRPMGHMPEATIAMILKLIVQPLLVWGLGTVFQLPPLWLTVAVVTAALPTGINASIFAVKYDRAVAPVATAVLLGTAVSAVTITMLLVLLSTHM
jgi:predicted permease